MNQSTINFLIKALGADEAAREIDKIGASAQKAGMNVKKYLNTTAGSQQLLAAQTRAAISAANSQAGATDKVAEATNRASNAQKGFFAHIAATTIQSALINKLFLEFVDVAGQAVKQVDLMQNFPATMKSMGQSTADATESMQKLSQYVGQVGGDLGVATSMVTRFTGATNSVKAATAIFTGINNALIAGDSSAEEQSNSLVQFAQALERGKPDMREWLNLTQNMSFQLAQVATSMGYVNANDLGEALRSGEESMGAFVTTLTEMSTGMGPIAQQAIARMSGMQFAFNVLKNTMVQGLAAILNAIGRANIVSFFSFLTQVVQVLAGWVVTVINLIGSLVNMISRLFGGGDIFTKISGDAAGVAEGLGAGAGAASDLGDNLDDAGSAAKKLNKQLASFDKMNVLADKESGSGGKDKGGGGGGSGFDPGQIGALNGLFDGLGAKLGEVSKWAKIFAGILAGIAALKFAGPILGEIKKITDGFKGGQKAVKDFGKALKSENFSSANTAGQQVGTQLKEGIGSTFKGLLGLIGGIIGGLSAVIGPAIAGVVTAGAGALGVSVGVFLGIIVAAFAVIGGVIFTLKDNWDTVVRGMTSIWEGFTSVLSGLFTPVVGELNEQWDKFYEVVRPGIEKIQELFKRLKENLAPVFKTIGEVLDKVSGKIKELYGKYIQPLIDKFKAWEGGSNFLIVALKALGVVITISIVAPIALAVAGIAMIVVGIATLAAGFIWLTAKIIEFIAYVVSARLWQDLQNAVATTIQWVKDKFTDGINVIKEKFNSGWKTIKEVAELIWDKISNTFNDIKDSIVEAMQIISAKITEKFNEIWAFIQTIIPTIKDFLARSWEALKHDIITIFYSILEGVKEIWNKVYDAVSTVANKIIGFFASAPSWLFDAGKSIVQGLVNGIKNLNNAVWNAIKEVADQIGAFFVGAWNWLYEVGRAIIQGLINGMKSLAGKAKDAITEVANGIKEKIKSIFGINSPSKLMTQYGGYIGQGLANGIEDSSKAVRKSLNSIQGMATGEFSVSSTASAPDIGSVDIDNGSDWVQQIAGEISILAGDKSQPMSLTVQIGEERIVSKVIELINEKTQMSGRNTILV